MFQWRNAVPLYPTRGVRAFSFLYQSAAMTLAPAFRASIFGESDFDAGSRNLCRTAFRHHDSKSAATRQDALVREHLVRHQDRGRMKRERVADRISRGHAVARFEPTAIDHHARLLDDLPVPRRCRSGFYRENVWCPRCHAHQYLSVRNCCQCSAPACVGYPCLQVRLPFSASSS